MASRTSWAGRTCSVSGTSTGTNGRWRFSQRICTVNGFFDAALVIADEAFDGGEIDAGVGAELGGGFFLAVVEAIDFGPFGPGIIGGAVRAVWGGSRAG
jgi:hypothetical protein